MARVLVVENERLIAMDISARLESNGHDVCEIASTAEQAIASARTHLPDIVLMDIRLDGPRDGIEAAESIQSSLQTPVVFLTASSDSESLRRAEKVHPYGYILKPFQDQAIEVALQMALSRGRLEKDLRKQKRTISLVVETLSEAVLVVDSNDTILLCNEHARKLLVGRDATLVGRVFSEVAKLSPAELAADGSYRAGLETLDGRSEVVELYEKRLSDTDDGDRLVVLRSIHSRVDYEQALIEAREAALRLSRTRGQFLSNVSHELRTPLNSILGISDAALETAESADQHDILSILRSGAHRLASVVESILDFSRVDSGHYVSSSERVRTEHLVNPVVAQMRSEAMHKGVGIEVEFGPNLPLEVKIDAHVVRTLLSTLLSNAIKLSSAGVVRVKVSCSRELRRLATSVEDTAGGIQAGDIDRVFEPFVQLEHGHVRSHGGIGLGLAIAARLAEVCGGEIDVQTTPGVGSIFVASTPFESVGEPPAPKSDGRLNRPQTEVLEQTNTVSPVRIALVDRDVNRARDTAAVIAQLGHLVEFENPEGATLATATLGAYDLCMVDLRPSPMLGRASDAARVEPALLEEYLPSGEGGVPTIAIVGTSTGGEQVVASGAAVDCVAPPLSVDVLREAILRQFRFASEADAANEIVARYENAGRENVDRELFVVELRRSLPGRFARLRTTLFRLILACRRGDIDAIEDCRRELSEIGGEEKK